ncbi:MAG: prephenate dehydrogenase [Chloroflexi bacterium]|nr:prephenate dehydrogenase [Chloroflexota bacterium]
MKVAIIGGTGKMGRWFASFLLKEGKEVVIIGRNEKKLLEAREQLGVEATTNLEAVKTADVVMISVPIDSFEEVVRQVKPHIRPKQIVVEITSVKASPVEMMHKHLKTAVVLGVHPMFGPGARDIANQNFVLTPTNPEEAALAEKVKSYLEEHDTRVTMMTPQGHDEMMSVVLGLSHFIAIVSADMLLSLDRFREMEAVSGSTYRLLLTLVKGVVSEDPELYASLQMNFPHMTEIEGLFLKSSKTWADIVKRQDKQEFVRRMKALKDRLEKTDPSFNTAYENMYRLLGK